MMNKRTFLKMLGGFGCAITISACVATTPSSGPVVRVGFAHLSPITLAVKDVTVRSDYKSPLRSPNVEHLFRSSPQTALMDWAATRLKANDSGASQAHLEFIIEQASVTETTLKKSKGFIGLFTVEPTTRYDAHAVASIHVRTDGNAGGSATMRVESKRSIEISENATLAQREQKWMELVENLMDDFNKKMESQIDKYLGLWRL